MSYCNRQVYTNRAELRAYHFAAVRMIVFDRGDSWTRYIVLDRRKILARVKQLRRKRVPWNLIGWISCPSWSAVDCGPGGHFRDMPNRIGKRNRRWIVVAQGGGLDI